MFRSTMSPRVNTALEKILNSVIKPSDSPSPAYINEEIIINAPLEKIFDFVVKPSNLPQICPSSLEIINEQSLSNGGYSAEWRYKMGGIFLHGTAKCTDITQNQWFTFETKGAINSKIIWTFRKNEVQTRVTFSVDYKVPMPVLGRLAEVMIIKTNEHEAALILANLKATFETRLEES